MSKRLAGRCGYDGADPFRLTFHEDRLTDPLKWKKPRRIGVSFMGDIGLAPRRWLDKVFAVMALAKQHMFFVLTKRPELLEKYLDRPETDHRLIDDTFHNVGREMSWVLGAVAPGQLSAEAHGLAWPLPNVLIGTSIEDQAAADERIPALLRCPGRRWMSVEPLLGPIQLPVGDEID
jgi:protein gp37